MTASYPRCVSAPHATLSTVPIYWDLLGADAVHVVRRHEAALRLQDVLRQTMYVDRRGQRFRQAVGTGN